MVPIWPYHEEAGFDCTCCTACEREAEDQQEMEEDS